MKAREKIESVGEDKIISLIRDGETQASIAQSIQVSVGSLNEWLHETDERSARARYAMSVSAEAWLDKGLTALEQAERDPSEIARAKAIEQHCARRAAIRNPQYRDKVDNTHSAPDGGPIKQHMTVEFIRPAAVDNAENVK